MKFPVRDAMTPEQALRNRQACQRLERGKYYQFNPPITAGGVPTGGARVHAVVDLSFDRGWYIGFVEGNHVFQGTPIDDPRPINDSVRSCYFHVLFIGGVEIELDPNQQAD